VRGGEKEKLRKLAEIENLRMRSLEEDKSRTSVSE
jgi:hypothetical protein